MLRNSFNKGILEIRGGDPYNFDSAAIIGGTCYRSTGVHPHVILYAQRANSPISLNPGTYRLRVQGSVLQGCIRCPILYLDLGKGFSEDHAGKIECCTEAGFLLSAVFAVVSRVKRVRLDPSIDSVDLAITRMTLERVPYSVAGARESFPSPGIPFAPQELARRGE